MDNLVTLREGSLVENFGGTIGVVNLVEFEEVGTWTFVILLLYLFIIIVDRVICA